jgi:hypothetical protein
MSCIEIIPDNICLEVAYRTNFDLVCVLLANGNPVDITFDTVRLTVRDYKGGTVKIQKTNGPGEHTLASEGKTTFSIEPADFVDDQVDENVDWVYEVRRIQPAPGNQESVHVHGDFGVKLTVGGEVPP